MSYEKFDAYMLNQGVPRKHLHKMRIALDLVKREQATARQLDRVGLIDNDGEGVTFRQLIEIFGVDKYVKRSGDGPEGLKDLL